MHHTTRSDYSIISDFCTCKNNRVAADPAIISDNNRLTGKALICNLLSLGFKNMVVIIYFYCFTENAVISDCYALTDIQTAVIIKKYVIADCKLSFP